MNPIIGIFIVFVFSSACAMLLPKIIFAMFDLVCYSWSNWHHNE